jgi:hypothetical protein
MKFLLTFIPFLLLSTLSYSKNQISYSRCTPMFVSQLYATLPPQSTDIMVEGKILSTVKCPPCPPDAYCAVCLGNYLIVSDLGEATIETADKVLFVFFNDNPSLLDHFAVGEIFKGIVEQINISEVVMFKNNRPLEGHYASKQNCPGNIH